MNNRKRSIVAWALYDWANSAFATTVMAGFFPLFFKQYWANPDAPQESTFYLGLANSLAAVLVALAAPVLGAIADYGSARKRFLGVFMLLGIVMTGSLWCVPRGAWLTAALFYVMAMIGFAGGNVFYDSLLPVVASENDVDRVSSLGYALGYIGGGLLFVVNVLMYLKPAAFGIPDKPTAIRLAFLLVALWWGGFSLPLFIAVREPARPGRNLGIIIKGGIRQLLATFHEIRKLRVVGLFLLAYWFYIDGVDTIIQMAVDYGVSLNFPASSLITALLLVQFIAFPATLAFNWVAERIGVKRSMLFAIAAYGGITVLSCFMATIVHFYILAAMVGLFQGGIQAMSRSLYTRLIPQDKTAEFFGFFNMLGKFAAVLGPLMMGTVTLMSGNHRLGILALLLLFGAGFILLWKVDLEAGYSLAHDIQSSDD